MAKTMNGNATAERVAARIAPFRNLSGAGLSSVRQIYDALPPTRETLAVLFAVDAAQTNPTEEWIGFFIETASSQLIWDERPTGSLAPDAAAWVLARFDEAPTLSIMALMVRLIEEAARMPADFPVEVRRRATLFDATSGQPSVPQSRRAPVPYLRLVA